MSKVPCVHYTEPLCKKFSVDGRKSYCVYPMLDQCKERVPSNADRIRAMTDEELATFIYTATRACNSYECESCPIGDENCPELDKWLKQPAVQFRDPTKMMGGADHERKEA